MSPGGYERLPPARRKAMRVPSGEKIGANSARFGLRVSRDGFEPSASIVTILARVPIDSVAIRSVEPQSG